MLIVYYFWVNKLKTILKKTVLFWMLVLLSTLVVLVGVGMFFALTYPVEPKSPSQTLPTAQGSADGLQLTMALEKTEYTLGEPVNITFTITNISSQTISLSHYGAGAFNMFEFRVYNDTNDSIWSLIYPVYPYNPGGPIVTVTLLNAKESLTGVLVWGQTCNNMAFSEGVPVSSGTYYIVGQIGPIFMNGLTIETTPIQIAIA
jgi:hypothetical protein